MATYLKIDNYWHTNDDYWNRVFKDINFSELLGEKKL